MISINGYTFSANKEQNNEVIRLLGGWPVFAKTIKSATELAEMDTDTLVNELATYGTYSLNTVIDDASCYCDIDKDSTKYSHICDCANIILAMRKTRED